jgi:hypothetical protein
MRKRGAELYQCGRAHPCSCPTIPSSCILYPLPRTLRSVNVSILILPYSFSDSCPQRLRFSSLNHEDASREVEACIRYLTDLENVWVGARRSRLIIEELLKQSRISTSIWDMSGIGAGQMGEYMFGQESVGVDLRGFDFG